MNNHPPITRDWFRRLYTEILQVTSPPSGEQIPASCLLSGPMFAELRRLADGVEEIAINGEPAPEFGAQPEHEPVMPKPEKLISPALLHALKQVWKGNASAVDLDQLITLSKLKLVVATGDYRQYVVTGAGRETVGIVPSG